MVMKRAPRAVPQDQPLAAPAVPGLQLKLLAPISTSPVLLGFALSIVDTAFRLPNDIGKELVHSQPWPSPFLRFSYVTLSRE